MNLDSIMQYNHTDQAIIYHHKIIYSFHKNSKLINLRSITKFFVSLAIGILFDEKKLKLNDPIKKFIKDFPYPNITIFHILTHSSGLNYVWDKTSVAKFTKSNLDQFVLNLKKVNKIGTVKYNNFTPNILTWIIRIITGLDVDEFLNIKIFKKLKIKYHWVKNNGICYGAFGLSMRANDLLKIGEILINPKNKFISQKYLKLMRKNYYHSHYGLYSMSYMAKHAGCSASYKNYLFGHDGSGGQYFFYNPTDKIILIRLRYKEDNIDKNDYLDFLDDALKLIKI